jgi:hypothetical protein
MKSFPDPKARDPKIRNRSAAYVRLLTFTRAAELAPPRFGARIQVYRAQASRLAELLQRNLQEDLLDPTLTLVCRLPWQPKERLPRVRGWRGDHHYDE